jgi:FkbM family methyltransferase
MKPLVLPPVLVRLRRKIFEGLGDARYSRPGLDGLDRKLEEYLDFDGGFFIEAGANDGVSQSNTYYLERFRGWRGVLIEGIPELAAQCKKNRPRAAVIQAALVEASYPYDTVEMHYAGLMSTVAGAMEKAGGTEAHIRRGLEVQCLKGTYTVRVPARTLTDVIAQHRPAGEIDLLSLDVEGMEAAVLRGLDFTRFAPRFLCVEMWNTAEIRAALGERYRVLAVLVEKGSRSDILFERTP